jgi:hypothetical protein
MPGVNGGGPIWSQLPNKDPCGSPSHNSKDDVKGRALAHVHYAKTGHEGGSPQISFQYRFLYVPITFPLRSRTLSIKQHSSSHAGGSHTTWKQGC